MTDKDIEKNIHDILKAVDSLMSVKSIDLSHVRLMLDDLLGLWESKYYFWL